MLFANIKKYIKTNICSSSARRHQIKHTDRAGLRHHRLLIVNKSCSNSEGNFHIKIDSLHAFPMIQIREDDGLFFFLSEIRSLAT